MTDYSKFKFWRGEHATEMTRLQNATKDSIFIFTRYKTIPPSAQEMYSVLYAQSISEVVGYFRHIFLFDLLNDASDDIELGDGYPLLQRQEDAISIFNFWFESGKIVKDTDEQEKLLRICKKFNQQYSNRDGCEYEFQVLITSKELYEFLIKKFSSEQGNKKALERICLSSYFDGDSLIELLKTISVYN